LPSAVSCAARLRPGVAVTQPGGRPCIHSTNSGWSRPRASVGAGAGQVRASQRVMAAVYGPHLPLFVPCPLAFPTTGAASAPVAGVAGRGAVRVGRCSPLPG
jgi:hypothetical protein